MLCHEICNGALYYSLSCNPDVTIDLLAMMREQQSAGARIAAVAQVNNNLPFMYDDAMVEPTTFDIVLDNPTYAFKLPGPPNLPVNTTDHMIGLLASTLLKDGGTLQIGIGSLGDAIVYATLLRHQHNKTYPKVLSDCGIADLRGKSDKEIIAALLNVTDSRFQEELMRSAKRAVKLPQDYRIPDAFMNNCPQRLDDELSAYVKEGFFPTFPLGTDFTAEELVLGKTLKALKGKLAAPGKAIRTMARAIEETAVPEAAKPYLERLQLAEPSTLRERMAQKLIISELAAEGHI